MNHHFHRDSESWLRSALSGMVPSGEIGAQVTWGEDRNKRIPQEAKEPFRETVSRPMKC